MFSQVSKGCTISCTIPCTIPCTISCTIGYDEKGPEIGHFLPATMLFAIYLQPILRIVQRLATPSAGIRAFADDLNVVAHTKTECSTLVSAVAAAAGAWSLRLRVDKVQIYFKPNLTTRETCNTIEIDRDNSTRHRRSLRTATQEGERLGGHALISF